MIFNAAKGLGEALALLVQRHPYRVSALLSLLASMLAIAGRGIVNSDGVVFFSIAELIARDGVAPTFEHYGLAFYSLLIHWGSTLTQLSYQSTADLLNSALFAFAGVAFAGLLRAVGASPFQLMLGIWLFALFPVVNEIRADVYRDAGYLAFSLAALWCYLDAGVSRRISNRVLALVCVLVAALFRVEALVLLLYPFALLLSRRRLLLIVLGFGLMLLVSGEIHVALRSMLASLSIELPFAEPLSTKINAMATLQGERIQMLAREVLNKHSSKHAEGFYLLGSAYLFLAAVTSNLRWHLFYLVVTAVALRGKYFSREIGVAILVLSLPLWFQAYFGAFLQARYAILISMLLIAFLVLHYGSLLRPDVWWKKGAMGFFVLVFFVDSFISTGPSRAYQREAVAWVQQNVPQGASVISNRRTLSYAFERLQRIEDGMQDGPDCETVARYDYYAYGSKRRSADVPKCAEQMRIVKTFSNQKGNNITLYEAVAEQP